MNAANTRSSESSPAALPVAFLGGSHFSAAGRAHRTAIEMDRRFEVVAGCFSRDAQVSAESARFHHVDPARSYASLDALLAAEATRIAAIVLLTPTDQHFEQIQRIGATGLPIICEKAMVIDMEQARALGETYRPGDRFLAVTYNYTGYPMLRELQRMIAAGLLGEIRHFRAEMPQEGFLRVDEAGQPVRPQQWRLRDGRVPTVSLDLGVHLHVLLAFLTGARPESVVAVSGTKGHLPGIVDTVSCLARYSGGIDGSIWFTKAALGHRNGMKLEIYGSERSATWVQEHPEQLVVADQRGSRQVLDRASPGITVAGQPRYTRFKAGHPAGFIEAFANYYADVADSLIAFQRSGRFEASEYVFGPEAAIEGIALLDAMARSSETGRWVDVR